MFCKCSIEGRNICQRKYKKLSEILQFTETENVQVYNILVEKETEFNVIRKKFKGDKDAIRAEIEKLNPIYNRRLKDILGKERMKKYHDYFKAKYKAWLESKK